MSSKTISTIDSFSSIATIMHLRRTWVMKLWHKRLYRDKFEFLLTYFKIKYSKFCFLNFYSQHIYCKLVLAHQFIEVQWVLAKDQYSKRALYFHSKWNEARYAWTSSCVRWNTYSCAQARSFKAKVRVELIIYVSPGYHQKKAPYPKQMG